MNRSSGKNDRERLKQKETLIIRLQHDLSVALQEIHWSKLKIQSLEEQLRQERIARFGPRSETLTDLQLSLLDEEPSVTQDEVAAEAERGPLPEPETPDSQQRSGNTSLTPGVRPCRLTCRARKRSFPAQRRRAPVRVAAKPPRSSDTTRASS